MILAAALALCGSVLTTADPPWGPFYQRSHAALSDNRLSYTPGPVTPAAPRQFQVRLGLSMANVWAQMPTYFYDGEWDRVQARVTYGVLPRWEVWAEMALVGRSGGVLDGFIEGFHRAFGITQARRNLYPRNRLLVATVTDGVQTDHLTQNDAGVGLANLSLGTKWLLAGDDGRFPKLAVEAALQLPVGSTAAQFATPCVGGLVALALEQPLGPWLHLDAAFGLSLFPGLRTVYGVTLSEVQKFLSVTLGLRLWAGGVLALGYLNQDGIADKDTFYPLSATSHEFLIGVRGSVQKFTWEAGIVENTVHDANTADFGFFAGGSYTI